MTVVLGAYEGESRGLPGWTVITPKLDSGTIGGNPVTLLQQQGWNYGVQSYDNNGTAVTGAGAASVVGDGTRFIYVDATSGNDSNPGTQLLPKQHIGLTFNSGVNNIRKGKPDWLLLKRGETWTDESFETQALDNFGRGGLSADDPMVITAYGTGARPIVKTANGKTALQHQGGGAGAEGYVAVMHIDFYSYQRDPASGGSYVGSTHAAACQGIWLLSPAFPWWLIEGCRFRFYQNNIYCEPGDGFAANLIIRRNTIVYSYGDEQNGIGGHSQGIGLHFVIGVTIEENFVDANGYNNTYGGGGVPSIYSRNFYPGVDSQSIVCRGNVFSRSGSEGLQMRGDDFTNYDNFFIENTTGFDVGHDEGAAGDIPPYLSLRATYNVVMESKDLDATLGGRRGKGIVFTNCQGSGVVVKNNIVAHNISAHGNAIGLQFDAGSVGDEPIGPVKNIICRDNIVYSWQTIAVADDGAGGYGNQLTVNQIDQVGYPAPNRSLASYAQDILGLSASNAAFYAVAYDMSMTNWDRRYTAPAINEYIRAGFAMAEPDAVVTVLLGQMCM